LIGAHVFAAERIHGDDTTVPVLASPKAITRRLWTYVRDDRPFGGAAHRRDLLLLARPRQSASLPSSRGLCGHPTGGRLRIDAGRSEDKAKRHHRSLVREWRSDRRKSPAWSEGAAVGSTPSSAAPGEGRAIA
jgi:hypothetical protein